MGKLVSTRITNRKDNEWKLALQHYGALGASVYGLFTYIKPQVSECACCILGCGIVLIFSSFLISGAWISLTQNAHAYDAHAYRHYMDIANFPNELSPMAIDKRKVAWKEWTDQQWQWFGVHIGFSIIIHIVVAIALIIAIAPSDERHKAGSQQAVSSAK